ncbi:NPC intracellular cholesterol transporter 2-like [Atheta coriaria]|uniref:NPC intracellular cholesterol transporter 2-like n=1 Tax=Dalotia coriaria TaxID=877792 RepID=UPI0031F45C2F
MKVIFILLLLGCIACSYALINQCSVGRKLSNLDNDVKLSGCRKTYCRLKKKAITSIQYKFTTEKDIKSLRNAVSAQIAGIPFPFIGFDGTDACPSIYEADGETKAVCPLKAGKEYIYKNNIDVLEIYPTIKVVVRWALESNQGQLMCFEVPARIVN